MQNYSIKQKFRLNMVICKQKIDSRLDDESFSYTGFQPSVIFVFSLWDDDISETDIPLLLYWKLCHICSLIFSGITFFQNQRTSFTNLNTHKYLPT